MVDRPLAQAERDHPDGCRSRKATRGLGTGRDDAAAATEEGPVSGQGAERYVDPEP